MATYKEIKGVTVQTLDSDPVVNVGSWSSGGSLNTARTLEEFGGWNTNKRLQLLEVYLVDLHPGLNANH